MSKLWWSWAAAGLCVLGCADDPASPGGDTHPASSSNAGTSNDSSTGSSQVARAGRGSVTLLGSNLDVRGGTWAFSGPAEGASDREDTVSCSLVTTHGHPALEVSASVAGAAAPAADFSVELSQAGPTPGAVSYDGSSNLELGVDVAFTQKGNQVTYSYTAAVGNAATSSCSVVVTALSDHWATGQVACRNLLATSTSADATLPDGSRGRASATIAFDCPLRADSAPAPGGSGDTGGSSSVGTGGSGVSGSGISGSSFGGSGVGGSPISLPKSCHGTVTPCSLQGSIGCESVQGCSRDGSCDGISRSCYAYFEASGCYGQQGCYWSSLSKNCQGSSWSCDLFDGSATCTSQYGCDWEETCSGVATPCSLLGEFTCGSQPGCSWY